jgi:hypothetical protein
MLQRGELELRDAAEAARCYVPPKTEQLLEEDLKWTAFSSMSFEGHDAGQVQNTFRQSLNY